MLKSLMQNEDYPQIALVIKNQMPYIEYNESPQNSKKLVSLNMGLDTALLRAGEVCGVEDLEQFSPAALSTADEEMIKFEEGFDFTEEVKLNLDYIFTTLKARVQPTIPPVTNQAAVDQELKSNWQADVLASVLEEIYNLLIAATLRLANDLGVENIKLADERKDPRLQEKMAKELSFGEIELIVDDTIVL